MRKAQIVLLLVFMLGVLLLSAQSVDNIESINRIKLDATCLYAESTSKDDNEAFNNACSLLEIKIKDWIQIVKPNESFENYKNRVIETTKRLNSRRGDFNRVFVYVLKSDVVPDYIDKNHDDVVVVPEANDQGQTEELPAEVEHMKSVTSFFDIESYINDLRSKDRLANYGKYATMPQDGDCYIFVYNKTGDITAHIKKSGNSMYNIDSLHDDDIKNYKNCGAVWFQLKD